MNARLSAEAVRNWRDLLRRPGRNDHICQLYQSELFLLDAVAEYVAAGLRQDEGVIVIARPSHRSSFLHKLEILGFPPQQAIDRGQLVVLDAAGTLDLVSDLGAPDWRRFEPLIGGTIAQLRKLFPAVRAYGEMVDILWQRGRRSEAIRLEEFWNQLAQSHRFSLLCAYAADNLDADLYGHAFDCVCRAHSHLIPTLNFARFNQAVIEGAARVLGEPLAHSLAYSEAAAHPTTQMPVGQAMLLGLNRKAPERMRDILAAVRDLS